MDQDGTWHGDRPQPRRLCVKWGPSPPPKFSAHVIIVTVISLEHCTGVRSYWFVQVQVSFSILCILILESLIVLSLSAMHSYTTAQIAEVGVAK